MSEEATMERAYHFKEFVLLYPSLSSLTPIYAEFFNPLWQILR